MQALVTAARNTAVVTQIPIPEPGANEIRIKVHSVALNPVDSLYVAHPPSSELGRVVGSDVAGTVDRIGKDVDAEYWKTGDPIAALLQGATSATARPGGFAEYAILEPDLTIRIPDAVSLDEAATFPLCSLTAAQALFIRLRLPAPFSHPFSAQAKESNSKTILIYSASTSLGLFAIQLAKLVRPPLRVLATASKKNHNLISSLGADAVFDYRSQSWVNDVVRASAGGEGINYALDCISEDQTTGMISQCFVQVGEDERIAVIRSTAWDANLVRQDVVPIYGAAWDGLGYEIAYNNGSIPADPASRSFTVAFFNFLSSKPGGFPIRANPIRLMPGGLSRIVDDGFSLLGFGKVVDREDNDVHEADWMRKISAEKLVYRLSDSI